MICYKRRRPPTGCCYDELLRIVFDVVTIIYILKSLTTRTRITMTTVVVASVSKTTATTISSVRIAFIDTNHYTNHHRDCNYRKVTTSAIRRIKHHRKEHQEQKRVRNYWLQYNNNNVIRNHNNNANLLLLASENDHNHDNNNIIDTTMNIDNTDYNTYNTDDPFIQAMIQLQYTREQCNTIIQTLYDVGLWVPVELPNVTPKGQHQQQQSPSHILRTLMKDFMISSSSLSSDSDPTNRNNNSNNQNQIQISNILIHDFHIPPLIAHQIRTTLLYMVQQQQQQQQEQKKREQELLERQHNANEYTSKLQQQQQQTMNHSIIGMLDTTTTAVAITEKSSSSTDTTKPRMNLEQRYKATIVRPSAKRRLDMCTTTPNTTTKTKTNTMSLPNQLQQQQQQQFEYSIQIHDFPLLQQEIIYDFYNFMTLPTTDSQGEIPIRPATANVYIKHAKLFLGWYYNIYIHQLENGQQHHQQQQDNDSIDFTAIPSKDSVSLYTIFPTKEKIHATCIIQYIIWLRNTRYIAVSYEAALLRGLCKLLKFRFRKESYSNDNNTNMNDETGSSSSNGSKYSFNDIPIVRELRILHRDANRRQSIAPRVSNEEYKWLSWTEYINVVQCIHNDLYKQIELYNTQVQQYEVEIEEQKEFIDDATKTKKLLNHRKKLKRIIDVQRKEVATLYQKYLILSFFANIPDRQRTIRELEIDRTIVRDNYYNTWCIKHTPDDYKTGKTYGERPPLQLPPSLTIEIDNFIALWRPVFLSNPNNHNNNASNSNYLFLGPRTGKPLSSDGVYQTVSKTCYYYTGKRTNPHLLRDMIVTHVRESENVSEQQLEALALFMGHSPSIQRKSYDRRTLTKKVAPAVALMEQVNNSVQKSSITSSGVGTTK